MEIIFGQHFDQGYFLDYSLPLNETVFNQMITGPLGLLNLLERELSLTGTYLSNVQRKINYQKILKEYVQHNPSAFFSKTFDNDPGGVAGELLKYRDQLILSGWNKEFNDVSDKIDCLRAIERFKQIEPGIEDRWRQIYESIDSANIPGMQLKRIVLEDELELMHPFFGQLFDLLRNKGLTIGSTKKDPFIASQNNLGKIKEFVAGITNECDLKTREAESFQIIRFRNDQEASEFFASQTKLLKGAVIINSDNNTFDDFQQLFNRPASGSEFQNANPQSIQLFKLALALFIKPLNIENILSYLQVPVHPIPLKLRMQLMKIIAQEGGVENEKWKEAIANYEFEDANKKKDILNFIKSREYTSNEIEKNDLLQFYNALGDWAVKRRITLLEDNPTLANQLLHLRELCQSLTSLLEDNSDQILQVKDVIQALKDTYEPMNIAGIVAQKGSIPVIGSPGQFLSMTDTIIWMDFYNAEIKPDYYSFLNEEEIQKLNSHGALIWKTESQSQSKMQVFKNAFLKTRKRCILVTCDKVKDSVTSEHPLHSLLKASVTNLSEFVLDFEEIKQSQKLAGFGYEEPGYMEIALQELPVTQAEVKINKGELIKKRKVESVSSIEMMIQFPFDWVLQYGAGIKPANSFQLPSIFKTLGDVSHKFVEELFTDAKFNIASANVLLLDFDKRIYKCMEECGAILLLDEHRFEKERFISRLKKSSKSLLALVEQNHLSIEGIEYKADGIAGILDDQNFMGYIDLFLKDDQDKPVIFDLKWTPSDKKYQKKVREGKSVQLSIYNALIKDAGIGLSKTAYFLLSSGKLITGSNFIGENVKRIDARYNEEEILEKVENSVNYRRQQFEDGIIEEGEEGQLTDLAYFIDQNEKSLIEIEGDSTGKKKKKNFYSSYNVLKGNIN